MSNIYFSNNSSNNKEFKKAMRPARRQLRKEQRIADAKIRNSTKRDTGSFGIFRIFILLLLIISFSYFIRNGTYIDFSFQSLIERLADCPDVSLSFARFDMSIPGNWGPFDFLRGFINQFTGPMEIMVTFTGFIVQMFVVLFYLLRLFFI